MKIVILDSKTLGNVNLDAIHKLGDVSVYETTSTKQLATRVKNVEVIITNKVVIDKDIIDKATNLQLICIAATGMNNVDLDYAKQNNIEVKNVTNYSTKSVVTTTFSMMFSFLCSSKYFSNYVKNGNYEKSSIFTHLDVEFNELYGKTWGIIGLGVIGKRVATIAQAFGCKVVYYSTSGNNTNRAYDRVTLENLLEQSDIISIHAPLNEKTKDLISTEQLQELKPNAIVLNMGRGGIINEQALSEFLPKSNVKVGLDVLENEPLNSSSAIKKILHLDNLFVTPHIAWASKEARVRLIEKIVLNIKGSI